jgi:hypothetical protein
MKQTLVAIGLLFAVVASDAIASESKPSSSTKSHMVKMPATGAVAINDQSVQWMVGFWRLTADEDGPPSGNFMEFRPNGTSLLHDRSCALFLTTKFHLFEGDIYQTYEVPGKGPVGEIFRPNSDHTHLTFTSIRTKNNAVYERATRCVPH